MFATILTHKLTTPTARITEIAKARAAARIAVLRAEGKLPPVVEVKV